MHQHSLLASVILTAAVAGEFGSKTTLLSADADGIVKSTWNVSVPSIRVSSLMYTRNQISFFRAWKVTLDEERLV